MTPLSPPNVTNVTLFFLKASLSVNKNETIWGYIKNIRQDYLKRKSSSECSDLISYSDIKLTYKELLRRLNITHSSVSSEIQNLTKVEIQKGAEMFLYLNSCPRHNDYWVNLFKDIIDGSVQRSYLLLLNISSQLVKNERDKVTHLLSFLKIPYWIGAVDLLKWWSFNFWVVYTLQFLNIISFDASKFHHLVRATRFFVDF